MNDKDIKVIYDEPWYWKISAYRLTQPQNQNNKNHNQIQQQIKPQNFSLQIDKPELKRDIACNRKKNGDPISPIPENNLISQLEIEEIILL